MQRAWFSVFVYEHWEEMQFFVDTNFDESVNYVCFADNDDIDEWFLMIMRVQFELNSDMCKNDIEQVDSIKMTKK